MHVYSFFDNCEFRLIAILLEYLSQFLIFYNLVFKHLHILFLCDCASRALAGDLLLINYEKNPYTLLSWDSIHFFSDLRRNSLCIINKWLHLSSDLSETLIDICHWNHVLNTIRIFNILNGYTLWKVSCVYNSWLRLICRFRLLHLSLWLLRISNLSRILVFVDFRSL